MEEYLRKALAKALDKIENPDIREKTLKAWIMAAEEGGWTPEGIEKLPFTLLTDCHGINLIEHTLAVTFGAAGLAKGMTENYRNMPIEINWDYIYAGGILHDVGKLKENVYKDGKYQQSHNGRCTRHPVSGTVIAAKVGLPDEILNIIANHAKEGEGKPQRIETVLIHQADFATFDPMVMLAKGSLIV